MPRGTSLQFSCPMKDRLFLSSFCTSLSFSLTGFYLQVPTQASSLGALRFPSLSLGYGAKVPYPRFLCGNLSPLLRIQKPPLFFPQGERGYPLTLPRPSSSLPVRETPASLLSWHSPQPSACGLSRRSSCVSLPSAFPRGSRRSLKSFPSGRSRVRGAVGRAGQRSLCGLGRRWGVSATAHGAFCSLFRSRPFQPAVSLNRPAPCTDWEN